MISATVRVKVNQNGLRAQVGKDARKFVDQVTDAVAIRARELAPGRGGGLRRSIRSEASKMTTATRATGRVVALAPYAVYQHEGTGIYGPRHREIRPRRDELLRFYSSKEGGFVYAKTVRGVKPSKFLVRAVDELLSVPPWKIIYFTTLR